MATHRPVVVLVAVLGLVATQVGAASAQGVPTVPAIPTIPGQETARFKVVVEGTAISSAEANGGGDGGAGCNVTIKDVDITERFKYGRGKGVTMEFVRFKAAGRQLITLQRSGRVGDASFAVRGKISRTVVADGLVMRAPLAGRTESTCPSVTEHPAASEGCNREFSESADMKFVYGARAGMLKLTPTSKLRPLSPVSDCPESQIFPGLPGLVAVSWPNPLSLPAKRLSTRTIFGSAERFKLVFRTFSLDESEPFPAGFTGKIDRSANHNAIVRFTRLK